MRRKLFFLSFYIRLKGTVSVISGDLPSKVGHQLIRKIEVYASVLCELFADDVRLYIGKSITLFSKIRM